MDKSEMKEFYNTVISPNLEIIKTKFPEYKKYFKILNEKCTINRLYTYYQRKRSFVYKYMDSKVKALDGHKVAACFIYAFLKSNVIRICRTRAPLPKELLMVNERLAFIIALNIVAMYRRAADGKSDFGVRLPLTYHDTNVGESEYLSNTCKALYYLRSSTRFDVFAYANILFLLEKYTDMEVKLGQKL